MKAQFVTDEQGKKVAVILPMKAYEKILDELDELECIKIYKEAKTRKPEFVKAEDMFNAVEQKRRCC